MILRMAATASFIDCVFDGLNGPAIEVYEGTATATIQGSTFANNLQFRGVSHARLSTFHIALPLWTQVLTSVSALRRLVSV
jgi:hypothetical protein